MNKFCTTLLAVFVSLAIALPAGAQRTSKTKQPGHKKNDIHYGHYHFKHEWQKLKALKQLHELKKTYNGSMAEAKQMFLEYLGSVLPTTDADIQKIRDEYEQQISLLNGTIASQQEQLIQANDTIVNLEQQLATANETITSLQGQIPVLNQSIETLQHQLADMQATLAAKEGEIDTLKTSRDNLQDDLNQCNGDLVSEYERGKLDGQAECPDSEPAGPPQQQKAWSSSPLYPYALDVDGSGNVIILDDFNMAVGIYDNDGQPSSRWDLDDTFRKPVDLAVDSQGAVYILDNEALDHLRKIGSAGQSVAMNSGNTPMVDPKGLFIDSHDNIYVACMGGSSGGRILVFDASGNPITSLCETPLLMNEPYLDVAVDEQNQFIYVLTGTNKVAQFTMNGGYVASWQGTFSGASSIAVGRQGQVFVVDSFNSEVYQYEANGTPMYTIGTNDLSWPYHIVVDDSGRLYVGDYFNGQVKIYR